MIVDGLARHALTLRSGARSIAAQLTAAATCRAGVLFVHGWDSDQAHYDDLSGEVAALGCTCLTFDLTGHGRSDASQDTVRPADNLQDVLAAHDALAGWPGMAGHPIVLVGTSYGAYLAAVASRQRPTAHLALRVPALYPDAAWNRAKAALDRGMLDVYRSVVQPVEGNRALEACHAFGGGVLAVASADDEVLPAASFESFARAFTAPQSFEAHRIEGADHALNDPAAQRVYASLLLRWIRARVPGESTATR